jgi:two-component sensor histidine kinase
MFEAFEEDELRLTSMAYARYLVEIARTIKNTNFQDMLPSLREEYDAVTKLRKLSE